MVCDKLIIHGTPDSVADQLLAFQDEVGPFGTLLYAGKAGVREDRRQRDHRDHD